MNAYKSPFTYLLVIDDFHNNKAHSQSNLPEINIFHLTNGFLSTIHPSY